jgi:hypothetical protein
MDSDSGFDTDAEFESGPESPPASDPLRFNPFHALGFDNWDLDLDNRELKEQNINAIEKAYRHASLLRHPDKQRDGTFPSFLQLQHARDFLQDWCYSGISAERAKELKRWSKYPRTFFPHKDLPAPIYEQRSQFQECATCRLLLPPREMSRHVSFEHPKPTQKQCPTCKKWIEGSNFPRHLRRHGPAVQERSSDSAICEYCQRPKARSQMVRHKRTWFVNISIPPQMLC